MGQLRITEYGEAVLKKPGEPITTFDASLAQLADDMIETMYAADGIGLAAQQIDQAIRLCVVDLYQEGMEVDFDYMLDGKKPPLSLIMPMALVNPRIQELGKNQNDYEEGCLSFPNIRAIVKRPEQITVEYQDLEGVSHRLTCNGLLARCIQHEVDHLNGVLFIDRMDNKELSKINGALKQLKKQTLNNTGIQT